MKIVLALGLQFLAANGQFNPGAYCIGGNTQDGDSNLGTVILNGVGANINDPTDCPGVLGVRDMTAQSASLQPGGTYTLTYDKTTCGSPYARVSGAWIDWNNNQNFEDNEKIGELPSDDRDVDPTVTETLTFTPPCDAATGQTVRMRVIVVESGTLPIQPCQEFSWGGAKDFNINILADMGSACGGSDNPTDGGRSLSTGWILLICFLVFSFVWIAGGCFYLRKYKNTTGVAESTLGYSQCQNFCGLVWDGCFFTKAKITGGSSGSGSSGSSYDEL